MVLSFASHARYTRLLLSTPFVAGFRYFALVSSSTTATTFNGQPLRFTTRRKLQVDPAGVDSAAGTKGAIEHPGVRYEGVTEEEEQEQQDAATPAKVLLRACVQRVYALLAHQDMS